MGKTGLVLEGGAMRAIYTAGVLDVFMEEGITFDGVIGVSAGAIHGCSFVTNQKGRNIRYYKKYSRDKRFMSFWNLLTTGDIVGEQFCYHELPDVLDPVDHDAFAKSNTEFYIGCTNLETGKAEYPKITDLRKQIDLIRASASMPYVSHKVSYDGKLYLDGGCADSIPVDAFAKMGFDRQVVVLTRDASYKKEPENTALAKIMYRKYPKFVKDLKNRHKKYNHQREQIARWEEKGYIYVIRPSEELNIGRMEKDPEELQRIYDIGVKDAKEHIEEVKAYLAGKEK